MPSLEMPGIIFLLLVGCEAFKPHISFADLKVTWSSWTAENIAAQAKEATLKAGGSTRPPVLDALLGDAGRTWDRMRFIVLRASIVRPVRLLTTTLLAYQSLAVEGDFIETGVARGGASILMMSVLDDAGSRKRHFACDSFLGLPKGMPQDLGTYNNCSVSTRSETGAHSCGIRGQRTNATLKKFEGQFKNSKREFELTVRESKVNRSRLVTVSGWFNETLPPKGLRHIAFLRLDGDLYQSTRDALVALYPLVSTGGAIYVDDYGSYGGCRLAVDEYREMHAIRTPMVKIWQNMTPITGRYTTPQARAGYSFEAVWWIKE